MPAKKAARPLGDFVGDLLSPACRKRGVAQARLMLDPVDVFGASLAASASVVRILWPRGGRQGVVRRGGENLGATLIVEARGGSALTLQHSAAQIVERANILIGWPAIAHLKVVQTGKRARPRPVAAKAPIEQCEVDAQAAHLPQIADQNLKSALAKLGASVARRSLSGGRKSS